MARHALRLNRELGVERRQVREFAFGGRVRGLDQGGLVDLGYRRKAGAQGAWSFTISLRSRLTKPSSRTRSHAASRSPSRCFPASSKSSARRRSEWLSARASTSPLTTVIA